MTLSLSVDPDHVLEEAQTEEAAQLLHRARGEDSSSSTAYQMSFAGRYATSPVPKYRLPEDGTPVDATYQLLKNELLLDGKPGLNLASFVNTWMPDEATKLMSETIGVNLCDQDEYPATMAIHARCISILSDLWKAPRNNTKDGKRLAAMGTATTGSSEAIMLGLMAAKRRWQSKMKAAGKDIHKPGPNLVFGSNVQVAVEKFARYWEVEERPVDIDETTRYCLSAKRAIEKVDENTIAVVVILGSTYTGTYEPVEEMAGLLDEYQKRTGVDVPIHVDAASGGMVAPFATPGLRWSFDIPRVASINTSGHKFGMVYPGIGWIVFRSPDMVPSELVFELHYLGSVEYSFGLNFSRPAAPMLGQMFNFINLGRSGFTRTMNGNLKNARLLSRALELSGLFTVLSDIHRPIEKVKNASHDLGDASLYQPGLPTVAFRWTDEFLAAHKGLEQRWVQVLLRVKGWIVPNYELPPSLGSVQILRVVVRDSVTENMIDALLHDIISITNELVKDGATMPGVRSRVEQAEGSSAANASQSARHHHLLAKNTDAERGRPQGHGTRGKGFSSQC
ncbi:glutamate decarboxylase [Malassezia sp. CBS 17886]|nr:glutamate decarboxylase [Malassezia sp. CBS 17886]